MEAWVSSPRDTFSHEPRCVHSFGRVGGFLVGRQKHDPAASARLTLVGPGMRGSSHVGMAAGQKRRARVRHAAWAPSARLLGQHFSHQSIGKQGPSSG